MDKIPVWIRLSALPLQLWTMEHFKAIGNFLGEFLEANMIFKEAKQRKVANILVCLNIREGLGEEVDLKWGIYSHTQKLNYENVAFRCRRCHQYGNLVIDCKLPLRTRGRVNKVDMEKGTNIEEEERKTTIICEEDQISSRPRLAET